AGWAVLCDFPAILIAASLTLYAIVRLGPTRHFIAFGCGALAVGALLIAYNQAAFGSPFFLSYEAYKLPGNPQFPEQAAGFVGLTYPRMEILWQILADPQRGLFFCNPVLVLSIPAFGFFAARRAFRVEFSVVAFAVVSMILFNAAFGESIVSWGGGTATGPRQIVAAVPFMVLTLAFLPAQSGWILAAVAFASALAMLMATAVEPHFPYEYRNPLRDFILPAYLRGDLAYNRDAYFGGPAVVDESTAFNLGKLAGLPGVLQLWPLAALWLATAFAILHKCRNSGSKWLGRPLLKAAAMAAIFALFALPAVFAITPRSPIGANKNGLMAGYFRGLEPSEFAPHLVRVDPQISFRGVAEMGALPAPSHVIWRGRLIVPRDGRYRFMLDADD